MSGPSSISVLLPVHNAARYLPEALASLAAQTWREFDVIAIDDGSTDESLNVLEAFARSHKWLRILHQEHGGVALALNRGMAASRSALVARMDADDICRPKRFEKQLAFLLQNGHVGVCGSWMLAFEANSHRLCRYPLTNAEVRAQLLFDSSLAHPAVMMRREVLDKISPVYRMEYRRAQDYDLWERLMDHTHFANLQDVLLNYRIHPLQASDYDRDEMMRTAAKVRLRMLDRLGVITSEAERSVHESLSQMQAVPSVVQLAQASAWLDKLRMANEAKKTFERRAFQNVLATRWFAFCNGHSRFGIKTLRAYLHSPLMRTDPTSGFRKIRFATRCLLRELSPKAARPGGII